jgi:hypothetical protein
MSRVNECIGVLPRRLCKHIQVIATYWSGPTAFLTRQNSFPLRVDGFDAIQVPLSIAVSISVSRCDHSRWRQFPNLNSQEKDSETFIFTNHWLLSNSLNRSRRAHLEAISGPVRVSLIFVTFCDACTLVPTKQRYLKYDILFDIISLLLI